MALHNELAARTVYQVIPPLDGDDANFISPVDGLLTPVAGHYSTALVHFLSSLSYYLCWKVYDY